MFLRNIHGVIKRYAVSKSSGSIISPEELDSYLVLYPDEEVTYIEVIEINGMILLLSEAGALVSIEEAYYSPEDDTFTIPTLSEKDNNSTLYPMKRISL